MPARSAGQSKWLGCPLFPGRGQSGPISRSAWNLRRPVLLWGAGGAALLVPLAVWAGEVAGPVILGAATGFESGF